MAARRSPLSDPRRRAPRRLLAALGALALAATGTLESAAQDPPAGRPEVAAIVPLTGKIDELSERTLETRVKSALEHHPRFLVLEVESGGGEVEACRNIAWNLGNLEQVTTVAYVKGRALSGATMVSFGCDLIAMEPDGQLGDVLPIHVREWAGQVELELAEKMISPLRKDLQQLAERRGYPVDVAAAMVDPSVELLRVEVKDQTSGLVRGSWLERAAFERLPYAQRQALGEPTVVCPAGKLLVIGPREATDMGICRFEVHSRDELLERLAAEYSLGKVVAAPVANLWWEEVVRWLTWTPVKLLLFVVGAIALLVAFAHPGLGAPELTAALCFGAFFFGSYLIGLADWIEVVLFVGGLVLLGIEVFVTPGFGVLGVLGALCVASAVLLSFQKFVVPSNPIEWDLLGENVVRTLIGCSLAVLGMGGALRFLPKVRLAGGLMHDTHQEAAPPPSTAEAEVAVGAHGRSTTSLRPVGKVEVKGKLYDAVVEGGLLEPGAAVVVIGHRAAELVVAARPELSPAPDDPAPAGTAQGTGGAA